MMTCLSLVWLWVPVTPHPGSFIQLLQKGKVQEKEVQGHFQTILVSRHRIITNKIPGHYLQYDNPSRNMTQVEAQSGRPTAKTSHHPEQYVNGPKQQMQWGYGSACKPCQGQ